MARKLPPLFGARLHAPRCPARRPADLEEAPTHKALEETTNGEHRNSERNDTERTRDRADPHLQRSSQPRLRCDDEARAAPALVRLRGYVAGGLRGRPESRRRMASRAAYF